MSGSVVTVEVAQGPDTDGGYGLAAIITVDIPGMSREQGQALADAAHALCPYSKATRGNIDVTVTARVAQHGTTVDGDNTGDRAGGQERAV